MLDMFSFSMHLLSVRRHVTYQKLASSLPFLPVNIQEDVNCFPQFHFLIVSQYFSPFVKIEYGNSRNILHKQSTIWSSVVSLWNIQMIQNESNSSLLKRWVSQSSQFKKLFLIKFDGSNHDNPNSWLVSVKVKTGLTEEFQLDL